MSITPEDLLAEAKLLLDRGDEMGVRLTINRAYYAAYHMALAVKDQLPPSRQVTRKGGKHEELLQCFEVAKGKVFPGSAQAIKIYGELWQSRQSRRTADYDLLAAPTQQDARDVVRSTEKIQALIAVFLQRQNL